MVGDTEDLRTGIHIQGVGERLSVESLLVPLVYTSVSVTSVSYTVYVPVCIVSESSTSVFLNFPAGCHQ